MRGGKGEHKSSQTLELVLLFSLIFLHALEIFLENVATFFILNGFLSETRLKSHTK